MSLERAYQSNHHHNDMPLSKKESYELPFLDDQLNVIDSSENLERDDFYTEIKKEEGGNSENVVASLERKLGIANINRLDIQTFAFPSDLEYDKDIFVQPMKYKKNEFYFGAGYLNRFSTFSLNHGAGTSQQKMPTYFSLGYLRKFHPSWSLGIEGSVAHIQDIPMSREIRDYHQASTTFEFIDGIMTHRYSNYIGAASILKYQPLFSRVSIYGGVNVAYAFYTATSFKNDFEGQNTVIEELRVFHTGSDFYKNWDYGLVAGATFKIWKGFEFEGRAVWGLVDVSDDYYWGERRNTTTHYRLGLKYRFL